MPDDDGRLLSVITLYHLMRTGRVVYAAGRPPYRALFDFCTDPAINATVRRLIRGQRKRR